MALPQGNHKSFADAHSQSDVDSDDFAQHHTLGTNPGQAAPGPHGHFGPWIDLPITAGIYTWIGAPWQKPQIRKSDSLKVVQCRGVIKNTSGLVYGSGNVFATAPVGYRPLQQDILHHWTDTGGTQQFIRYDVYPTGALTHLLAIAAGSNIGLTGLQWYIN